MSDRENAIKAALGKLDTSEPSDWTQGGLPAVDRMKELTGLEDLKREEISAAAPGLTRDNVSAAPSDLSNVGTSDVSNSAGPSDLSIVGEQNEEAGLQGNDAENEAARLEGEAAEQADAFSFEDPAAVAEKVGNPVLLLEAAVIAMNANERYRKNAELQAFMRGYYIQQTNIKAHQTRLDKRFDDAEEAAKKSAS